MDFQGLGLGDTRLLGVARKRAYPRFEANTPVRLFWTDGSYRQCEGVCTDVAVGGVGVYAMADFHVDDYVRIEFPGLPLPSYKARIVYRNGFDYGLYFLEIV